MPIYTENAGDQGLPRNIFIRFLIFLTLIGMSAVVMKPLQTALQMGMANIRGNFIEKIEEITGLEVRYSSIRPTIFGSFDLRNLNLIKNDVSVLSASRTRLSFSILELLRGKKSAIYAIQIERPVLKLDLEKDRELIELFTSLRENSEVNEKNGNVRESEIIDKIADFFPDKPEFKIRDCYLNITDGAFAYNVENMHLDLSGNRDMLLLDGKFAAEVRNSGLFGRSFGVKTEVGISGAYSLNLEEGDAKVVFSSLSVSQQKNAKSDGTFFKLVEASSSGESPKALLNTQPLAFQLVFKDRLLSLKTASVGIDDASHAEASSVSEKTLEENEHFFGSFEYHIVTGRMAVEMDCDNFSFSDIVTFSNSRNSFNHLLSLPVVGNAQILHEKNTGLMRYDVNFRSATGGKTTDSFAIRVNGSEKYVSFDEFRFDASANTAKAGLFQGRFSVKGNMGIDTLTPRGTIVFDGFSFTGLETFDAVFNVSSSKNEIAITSDKAALGKCVLSDVELFIFPSQKDLGFLFNALREKEGRVSFDATLNYKPRQFDASLALGSFSALDLLEISRPFSEAVILPPASGLYLYNTFIDAELFFTTDFLHYVYNAPNIRIKSGETEGSISFSGTDRRFSLSEGIFIVNEQEFLVSAQVNYPTVHDLAFTINASYLDFSWHVEGQILDKTTLIVRDPNGLHAYGNVSNTGALSGYIEGISFPFPVGGQPVYLNFYITLRYTSKDFWSVDVARFEAVNLSSHGENEYLKVSGTADQDGASFRDLVYSDKTGMLAGSADCLWDSNFSYVHFIVSMTDGKEGGEWYSIDGIYKEKKLNVNASVSDMRVDRFFKKSRPVLVNAQALIFWESIKNFNININLNSFDAKIVEHSMNASAALVFTNDEFSIKDLNLNYADVITYMPLLQINRADGFVKANADVQGFVLKKWLDGKIEIDAGFLSTDSWMEIREVLNSINGSIKVNDLWYNNVMNDPFQILFANNKGNMMVNGGPGNMLRVEMDREGDFFAALSSPFPIHASIAGNYKDGIVDAHCNDFFLDLSALWNLVPTVPEFAFSGGYVTAKLDIRGPLLNPEYFGTGRASSLRMSVPNFITEEIKPIPFNVTLEGSEMSFGPVQALVGKGVGSITGLFVFEKWVPDNFTLDIKVLRENPVPYAINISGFLAQGDVSGDLLLILDNKTLDVTGSLFANNTEMGMSFDDIMQSRSEYAAMYDSGNRQSASANIVVTTGPVVEFAWPNSSSPILRANPEMGTVAVISADTLTGQYSITTDVKLRSGEINYFDRNFYIRQGTLVFKENERQFSPRLTARAEIRDRTDSGPVTISMIIDNEPLLNFVPRFEANPVLTQYEIFALLGHNTFIPGGGENIDAAQLFLTSTADLLGQFIGLRTIERQVRNVLGLDMFSVRTKILQNAVSSGVRAAGIGADTQQVALVDRNSRVGNYFDNTTVFAGKYVGQDMFVQGMLSLGFDENSQKYGGLKPELDFGIELQSPLFNIRWDFFPYHPENWWVTDNSITLTWSKSF